MREKLNILGVVPARMASSRFPGKPLATILGIPMVVHVYFRSKLSNLLDDVYVATCDREIADYIESVGGKAVMTADTHQRASDRTAEALIKIEEETKTQIDIIVMIQGDEPMLMPKMIDEAVHPMLADKSIRVTNLMAPLITEKEFNDTNVGGVSEVVVDGVNGLLLDPDDNQALEKALRRLITDTKIYDRLAKNALITLDKFSLETMLDQTEQALLLP